MRYIVLIAAFFISIAFRDGAAKAGKGGAPVLEHQKDTMLTLLTYGLMRPAKAKARYETAKKYGFSYVHAAGCVITKELIDSINKHNAKVEAELAWRHGVGWKLKFEAEVDALHTAMMAAKKE